MKILLTKTHGQYADEQAIGLVHITGVYDATACGLAYEEYVTKNTNKPVNCSTCLSYLSWARAITKHIKQK